MAKKQSAGILLYRLKNLTPEFFLVHPGGPFWAKKDAGSWSIPKGEFDADENALAAAKREFREETGIEIAGKFIKLTPVKQKSGKLVFTWAVQGDLDSSRIRSNLFEIEWPPKSGKKKQFPEIDKGDWFSVQEAKEKILPAQVALIEELLTVLKLH
jgi:predicted NUDIX family NTP pyrophosphohydrolase